MCESEKVGVDLYASMFPDTDRARSFAQVIHGDNFDNNPTAALEVWNAALERVLTQARDANISSEIPEFALAIYEGRCGLINYGVAQPRANSPALPSQEASP